MNLKFNRNNHFGKHMIFAFVPGFTSVDVTGVPPSGTPRLPMIGSQHHTLGLSGGNGSNSAKVAPGNYGHLGSVRSLQYRQESGTTFSRYWDANITVPELNGLRYTSVIAIVKLVGDGRPPGGVGDPRIFSMDNGTSTSNHDYMLGIANTGNDARCRISYGSGTVETVICVGTIVDDSLCMFHAFTTFDGTNFYAGMSYLADDGTYDRQVGSPRGTASVFLNSGRNLGLGATAATASSNPFNGDILAVYGFSHDFDSLTERQALFRDPWQVFAPQSLYVPLHPYDPNAIVLEETAPQTINETISFDLNVDASQINLLTAAVSQTFTINLDQAQAGDLGATTLTITLVDSAGTPLQNLSGLTWAWFDESAVNSLTTPPDVGTGATTDTSGQFSVDLTNTTLTAGQTGTLAVMDSTGYIYALYRITLS